MATWTEFSKATGNEMTSKRSLIIFSLITGTSLLPMSTAFACEGTNQTKAHNSCEAAGKLLEKLVVLRELQELLAEPNDRINEIELEKKKKELWEQAFSPEEGMADVEPNELGELLQEKWDATWEQGWKLVTAGLTACPLFWDCLELKAAFVERKGNKEQYEEARKIYEMLLDPETEEFHLIGRKRKDKVRESLAWVLSTLGQEDDAVEVYEQQIGLGRYDDIRDRLPFLWHAWEGIMRARVRQASVAQAEEANEELRLGYLLQAEQAGDELIKLKPTDYRLVERVAQLKRELGHHDEARKLYEQVAAMSSYWLVYKLAKNHLNEAIAKYNEGLKKRREKKKEEKKGEGADAELLSQLQSEENQAFEESEWPFQEAEWGFLKCAEAGYLPVSAMRYVASARVGLGKKREAREALQAAYDYALDDAEGPRPAPGLRLDLAFAYNDVEPKNIPRAEELALGVVEEWSDLKEAGKFETAPEEGQKSGEAKKREAELAETTSGAYFLLGRIWHKKGDLLKAKIYYAKVKETNVRYYRTAQKRIGEIEKWLEEKAQAEGNAG
jgi:hypothetical protein